ncbi:g-type lysozyme inhibitor [Lysobacter sp. KIS68-7]|uniref:g-type lysozyme inhibitor n=1 Tax=Lysobacter sp. KIS68-7 TaxID=2904252 RepID=UPI001E6128B3|nr:g-type lysozyme inhibitor [Lysobacter sp. KIS68-7]UHQ20188.1 g-type lysozyme inhibitor [Lysobacter sp. KIS68-7]
MPRNSVLACGAALALLAAATFAADKVPSVPVHFEKGSSSASMKGSLSGYDSVEYSLGAKAGQTMTVKITGSSNANFNVFAPGEKPGASTAIGTGSVGTDWSGTLPKSGDYTIQVFQMRASARRAEAVPFTIAFEVR